MELFSSFLHGFLLLPLRIHIAIGSGSIFVICLWFRRTRRLALSIVGIRLIVAVCRFFTPQFTPLAPVASVSMPFLIVQRSDSSVVYQRKPLTQGVYIFPTLSGELQITQFDRNVSSVEIFVPPAKILSLAPQTIFDTSTMEASRGDVAVSRLTQSPVWGNTLRVHYTELFFPGQSMIERYAMLCRYFVGTLFSVDGYESQWREMLAAMQLIGDIPSSLWTAQIVSSGQRRYKRQRTDGLSPEQEQTVIRGRRGDARRQTRIFRSLFGESQ